MSKKNFWVALCAAVGLSAAMVAAGAAGASAARGGQNSNSGMSTAQGNMNGGGSGMMMLSSGDRKFMMTAAQGGMAEVEMARVALERASSEEVKAYAQRMIDDHTKANEELMGIAQAKGVTLPAGPDAKHMAMLTKMRALSGAAFDREYVMMAGRKDHEKMEKLFRDESTKGKDADVKAFAAKTLPVVREHLSMARMLNDKMMGMKMNSNSGNMGGMNSNMGGSMNSNMNSNMNGNMNSNMNRNTGGNMNRNMNSNMNRNMNGNMNSNRNMNSNNSNNSNR